MSQLQFTNYINKFGGALLGIMTGPPIVPVHYSYNTQSGQQSEFLVWHIRNVQQDVYTGSQLNKGIDRPIFGINVFTKTAARQLVLVDVITNNWHGYSGNLNGISVGKASVDVVLTSYDEESSLFQAVIDIAMQVAVPTFPTIAASSANLSSRRI